MVCGRPNCAIAESYPMQVICETPTSADPTAALQPTPGADPCAQAGLELQREVERITSCTRDADCGLVLEGTSCGCTRDLVARLDAGLDGFESRRAALRELGCPAMGSTCDCPEADGFRCDAGHCAWNYTR